MKKGHLKEMTFTRAERTTTLTLENVYKNVKFTLLIQINMYKYVKFTLLTLIYPITVFIILYKYKYYNSNQLINKKNRKTKKR